MIPENIKKLLQSDIQDVIQLGIDIVLKDCLAPDIINLKEYINKRYGIHNNILFKKSDLGIIDNWATRVRVETPLFKLLEK